MENYGRIRTAQHDGVRIEQSNNNRSTRPFRHERGILNPMNGPRSKPKPDDYVLLPSVTHPGGRERAFEDAYKAMVRFMIEVNDNPTIRARKDDFKKIVHRVAALRRVSSDVPATTGTTRCAIARFARQ